MDRNLKLTSQEQIDLIANAVSHRRDLLQTQVKELQSEISDLESILFQINAPDKAVNPDPHSPLFAGDAGSSNGYNKSWSFTNKALYILRKSGRPMTTAEIADKIVNEYESDVQLDRRTVVRNLSVTLVTMKNVFIKGRNINGQNVYLVK